jgi:outer membrane protein TolC
MHNFLSSRVSRRLFSIFVAAGCISASGQAAPDNRQVLSLSDCLHIAMEKNHSRPSSQFAVDMAEAQHRQALAAYWPQISAQGGVDQMSSFPNFVYPASGMEIPARGWEPCWPRTACRKPKSFSPVSS